MMENDFEEIKLYSDYKSPYAYLAFDPGFALEEKYRVRVRWIPFQLRIKGKGERSVYSEYKVKYSYLDAGGSRAPRTTEDLRHQARSYRRPLCPKARQVYGIQPFRLRGVFQARIGN